MYTTFQHSIDHINNQDPHIKFTIETEEGGRLPFLDTTVVIGDNSNHPINHKRSVVRTLQNWAKLLVLEKH